jgi:hypothetical protein
MRWTFVPIYNHPKLHLRFAGVRLKRKPHTWSSDWKRVIIKNYYMWGLKQWYTEGEQTRTKRK